MNILLSSNKSFFCLNIHCVLADNKPGSTSPTVFNGGLSCMPFEITNYPSSLSCLKRVKSLEEYSLLINIEEMWT
jgi:hypothetical protein